jgi:predicted nucleic acid-binding protein
MSFVYLDTSVAMAHLLAEDHAPPALLWDEVLMSSRLLEYEVWNRVHAYRLGASEQDAVRRLIGRVSLVELVSPILDRAREPFPVPLRTLDALHLSTISFLEQYDPSIRLATYDAGMQKAAQRMHFQLYKL